MMLINASVWEGKGGESVPLALILQFDHCLLVTHNPNFPSSEVARNACFPFNYRTLSAITQIA